MFSVTRMKYLVQYVSLFFKCYCVETMHYISDYQSEYRR